MRIQNASRFIVALLVLQSLFYSLIIPTNVAAQSKRAVQQTPKQTQQPINQDEEKSPLEKAAGGVSPLIVQPGAKKERKFEEDVQKRREWFRFQRRFPFNEIPVKARENAFAQAEASRQALRQPDMVESWQSIGPRPTTSFFDSSVGIVSGRINAIAVSPADSQLILVGGVTGGIWRSTDGGANWTPVTDNQADLAVGSIAFAPSNPNVVYAGMGSPGNGEYLGSGVLKSTDAGQTWTRVGNAETTPQNERLPDTGITSKILVHPTNPDKVFLALKSSRLVSQANSQAGGIYISTNGGVNWSAPLTAGTPPTGGVALTGDASDLALHPTNPQIVYAAFPSALWRSTNGGVSFSQLLTVTNCTNSKVAVTPAAPSNVYFYFGNDNGSFLQISQDTGSNWQPSIQPQMSGGTPIDTGQFGYNNYLAVAPNDANVIYIGNRDLFRSTNGGTNWTNLTKIWFWDTTNTPPSWDYSPTNAKTHSDQQTLTFSGANGSLAYIGNDGGITKISNPATTPVFESLNENLSLTQFIGYTIHPTNAARSYGGSQDNGTQRRLNNSDEWKEFDGGDGGIPVLNPTNPSQVITNYPMGSLGMYSQNGASSETIIANGGENGTNWNGVSGERVCFYAPLVNNGTDDTIYFGTRRVWAANINVNPIQWFALGGNTDLTAGGTDVLTAIGVQRSGYSTSQTIYTGSALGTVTVSQDGGQSWSNITAGLPNRFVKSITVKPGDANTAYITYSGFTAGDGTGHVYRTTDAGATWVNISGNPTSGGLPDIPVNSLLIDPNDTNKIYVGTDIGVFRTTDGGTNWQAFNNGIPPAIVNSIVSTSNGATIQVGTYGRGAYQLNNGALFQVTYPNIASISWNEGSQQTVTWHVGGDAETNVNILLSADGGQTFPFTLASNTANDAAEAIYVPNVGPTGTTQARIKVEAVGNAFSDISDVNFTITDSPVHNVNGRITVNDEGRADISVSITDFAGYVRTAKTDANGDYLFYAVPASSDYTITPMDVSNYVFAPKNHTTGNLTADVTRNFIAQPSRRCQWTQLSQVIAIQEGNPQNIQRNNHWNNPVNWNCSSVPTAYDRVTIDVFPRTYQPPGGIPLITYTPQPPTLNGLERTVNSMTLDGGSLTGGILNLGNDIPGESKLRGGTLDVVLKLNNGSFEWIGGTFHSAATVAADATFIVTGDSERVISRDGVIIDNAGTMLWSDSPTVRITNPCFSCGTWSFTINNTGTTKFQGTESLAAGDRANIVFNNYGTTYKTSQSPDGATVFKNNGNGVSNFVNYGTLNVSTGILAFNGGGALTPRNGSTIAGGGLALINGGLLYLPYDVATVSDLNGNLEFRSGRVDGRGTFNGSGVFNWTGGTFGITQGAGYPTDVQATFGANTTVNISGDADKHLGAFSTTCQSCYQQPGRLILNGTTNWTGAGRIYGTHSHGPSGITNNGTFNVRNDSPMQGDSDWLTFINNGIVKKENSSGTTRFGDRLAFNNSGTIDNQSSGAIEFTQDLNLNAGSLLTGAGAIKSKGVTRIYAPVTLGDSGAAGRFEFAAGSLEGQYSNGVPVSVINSGNVASRFVWLGGELHGDLKLGSSLTTELSGAANKDIGRNWWHNGSPSGALTNTGTINIEGGNVRFGYHYSTLVNSGTINIAGNVNFTGNYYTPLVTNTGTINKVAPLGEAIFDNAVNFVNSGTLNVQSGLIEFNRDLYLDTGTIIKGDGLVRAKGTTRPRGTTVIGDASGGGKFEFAAGAIEGQYINDVPNSFINSGNAASEFRWTGGEIHWALNLGAGLTTNITGSGNRDVGRFNFHHGSPWGVLNNAGTINWHPGSDIRFAYHSATINNSGTFNLLGNGTIHGNYYGGSIVNTGTIEKINIDGATTIASNLGFNSTGTIKLSLGAATNTNRLNVGGATLGGTLNVKFVNGFNPADSDTMQVIGYSSRNGSFNNVAVENLPSGRSLQTRYNATNLTVRAFSPVVPVPNTPAPENWFKADALSGASNSVIPTWTDASGKLNNATQSDANRQPKLVTNAINGLPVVRFDGANDQMQFPRTLENDFTITTVFQSRRGLGTSTNWWEAAGIIDGEVGGVVNDFGISLNVNGRILAGIGNPDTTAFTDASFNDGRPHILTVTRQKSSGEFKIYVDGILRDTKTGSTAALTAPPYLTIGSRRDNANYLNGDIAEIITYGALLSDADRAAVDNYLTTKYISNAPQTVWDAATDFLPNRNPAFAWTYGYLQSGTFNAYTSREFNEVGSGIDRWGQDSLNTGREPSVRANLTGALADVHGTIRQTPDELTLHPQNNLPTVVRWTAPEAGTYLVQGRFDGNDYSRGTTSDVKLNHNANTLLASPLFGFGTVIPFNRVVTVAQNDTIDFIVGTGTGGFAYDATGVAATITKATTSISGRVTNVSGGAGVAGVTVNLKQNNSTVATATTDLSGNYAFASNLAPGGNYTIEAASEDYTFAPASASINNLSGNQTADFAATQIAFFAYKDFSIINNNPNGGWSYGWSVSRGSTFNLLNTPGNSANSESWTQSNVEAVHFARLKNGQSVNKLQTHPGPQGQNSVLRWTAPATGTYRVFGVFEGGDYNGWQTSTDVAVLRNSQALTTGYVNGGGNQMPFDLTVTVQAGETIDFSIGFGVNNAYNYDATLLEATIRPASATANSIAGTLTNTDSTTPVSGAVVSLYRDGRFQSNLTTNAQGQYSFLNLATSGNYIVTAAKAGMTFKPASRSFLNLSGAKTADFTTGTSPAQTVQCVLPPANLVSWYKGEDNAVDRTGGNNGTLETGVTYVDGKVGRAFDFNQTGAVALGNPANLKITNALTISAWIKPRAMSDGQYGTIVGKWNNVRAGDSYLLFLYKRPSGGIELAAGIGRPDDDDPGLYGQIMPTGATITPNEWSHVAMTYNAADGTNIIYVNGIEVGRRSRINGINSNDTPVYIGRRNASSSQIPFNGAIDEPAIFNRVLSAAEIRSLTDADTAGQCAVATGVTAQGAGVTTVTNYGSVNFPNVTTAGETTFTPIDPTVNQPVPPSGFSFGADLPAFDVTTTATYSGTLTLCFEVPLVSDEVRFSRLRVLHVENGNWVDRTSSRNFSTRTVCAQTTSLSPFAIVDSGIGSGRVLGTVTYGITPQGQTVRTVPGVTLSATGGSNMQTITDNSGAYQLTNFAAGQYTVTPSKTSGAGQPFSTVDATRILQAIVGLTNLSSAQQAAADSDSTNDLSTVDASNILRAIVGLPGTGTIGQWKFLPASRVYPSVTTDQTNQNYEAVVIGDVDGDWTAEGARLQENRANSLSNSKPSLFSAWLPPSGTVNLFDNLSPQAVTVSLPANASAATGTNPYVIPITVGNTTGENITGFNFVLDFNNSGVVLQPAGAGNLAISRTGTLSQDFSCSTNTTVANRISVACAGDTPIEGAGTLLNLRFNVVGAPGAQTNLTFTQFRFNAGTPVATVSNGSFTVSGGPTAAPASVSGRVMIAKGVGIADIRLTLTEANGTTHTTFSDSRGLYSFTGIDSGQTVIISVHSGRFRFTQPTQVLNLTEDITGVNFTAQRGNLISP